MDILQYRKAICYSGYRKGQNPKGDVPTTEQIAEVEKLIALVKEFPDEVIAVSVGNENTPFWGAHMVS